MTLANPFPIPQRWERPFNFPPGFWKQQLPGKYLHMAARGDLNSLRQLLADHPDYLSKRGSHNRTLLWEATRRGRLETVQWLLDQGAELDATGAYNSESHIQITLYCAAIYYHRPQLADLLRSHHPMHDIFRAAFLGDQQRVDDLLASDPSLLNAEDPHDPIYFIPLIAFPVTGGHLPLVESLLKRGANVKQYSALLLDLATRAARLDILELLVAHGVDPRAADAGIALTAPDLTILEYLLKHGAPTARVGKNSYPPLVYISRSDKAERPDKVQMLLEYGADVNERGPKMRTALHWAALAGHLKVLTVLIDYGADPTLRDQDAATALSLARMAGKTAAARLLEERGAKR